MKELEHLKPLSSVKTNAGVKFLTPAAFPGNHCPMHTALALSAQVKGMSTLVVGTAECGTYSRNVISRIKNEEGELHWTYILDSTEVVFGCRKGLIKAIKEMDKSGAKAIMIILTCVPEVIGEDIEAIVHELQPQVSALLTFVLMAHFKCNSYPSGYWKTLVAFESLMKRGKTRADTINILGRSPREKHVPMPELLTALEKRGFYLRMLAPKSDIKDFIVSPDAALNLVLSPFMNPLAEMMWEKFQVPFISLHEIYDVYEIDNIYEAVAKSLKIRFNHEFDESREKTIILQNQAKDVFKGKSYILTHIGAMMPLPLVLYLAKFEMNPTLLHMDEFYPDDRKWAKAIKKQGYDPMICHMVNDNADIALLERIKAEFSLGELLKDSVSVPCAPYLEDLYGQMGYERTVTLLSRMLNVYEKVNMQEIRRNSNGNS
ncbi:nitrogenase component 1 type Oxidoreductase family protein [Clostridium argentinense CDC 2741]|uniref:Nitrogenase component 1 type Oxidoreductase family protein n=1 Tax=Clostridium argentinense CDC 2741 TaxID=1418104 RepID=A0A0C1R2M0_9CLOT|nr:nitrogenase component 1 [Clostridium argentinense]ARC86132.1 nitrogen fixation protein NifE [Clostridium argentinense]KIE47767.1 nitrogenase component 1 type Oxidoreductase family protein [Clostridium argentinense CDC 2741]NFF40356.1 nitrogen fixation protein NifE [Clostridium argentinense]NFP50163.1 nitrogen fixation protein NifE [Clostridium argentinense]NFP72678.1 nitrogen fixation protein NifE [Clostridium argentinense]